jgi:2-amino-4-hydroxy-6-hydroxymethyldihydropteridine diphosphokinase
VRFWIGLGSNLGDRLATLRSAAAAIGTHCRVLGRSRVFASSPMGGPPQPPFLNAALLIETELEPQQLLAALQQIESDFGRSRDHETVRWGPRTLDLDLLLVGDQVVAERDLTLPHPALAQRRFALEPLAELAPELVVPGDGRTVAAVLAAAPPWELAPVGRYPL